MLNEYFIKQGVKEVQIEEFIKNTFPSTDYSKIELQRTPLGIKIVIYTHKPGRVIGRSGSKINEITSALKERFDLDNPQLDVKSIGNPNLDSRIVAKQIKTALERGYKYKKIGNMALKRIMDAGAVGAEIVIAGKLGGSKGRTAKFIDGYIKHCGDTAKKLVDRGFEEALTKPGKIGIQVKIMKQFVTISGELKSAGEKSVYKIPTAPEAKKEERAPIDEVAAKEAAEAAAPLIEMQAVEEEPKKAKKAAKDKSSKAKDKGKDKDGDTEVKNNKKDG